MKQPNSFVVTDVTRHIIPRGIETCERWLGPLLRQNLYHDHYTSSIIKPLYDFYMVFICCCLRTFERPSIHLQVTTHCYKVSEPPDMLWALRPIDAPWRPPHCRQWVGNPKNQSTWGKQSIMSLWTATIPGPLLFHHHGLRPSALVLDAVWHQYLHLSNACLG